MLSVAETVNVDYVYWCDIRERVLKINPELCNAIDAVNPGKKYRLLRAKYNFGDVVVDSGVTYLPTTSGSLEPLNSQKVPLRIQEDLGYCPIPLALTLSSSNEVFITTGKRIIPLNFFKAGDLFGVFETINPFMVNQPIPMWTITAGARSIFMLPRITDTVGHKRIRRECGVSEEVPADLVDHWKIFSQIAHHLPNDWKNEVIFFTKDWFESLHRNNSWRPLHGFLFKTYWIQQRLFRDTIEFDLMWESFILAISSKNLKPRPYLIDTVKHLVLIASGAMIAFRPATDEAAAPVGLLQHCYVETYGLKTHTPTIIEPCKLDKENHVAYYSLSYPTVPGTTPFLRNAPSLIEDQRDIVRLIDTLKKAFKNSGAGLRETIGTTDFELFHSERDPYNKIKSTKDINVADTRFNYFNCNIRDNRVFCNTAQFMRGCIKISRNLQED